MGRLVNSSRARLRSRRFRGLARLRAPHSTGSAGAPRSGVVGGSRHTGQSPVEVDQGSDLRLPGPRDRLPLRVPAPRTEVDGSDAPEGHLAVIGARSDSPARHLRQGVVDGPPRRARARRLSPRVRAYRTNGRGRPGPPPILRGERSARCGAGGWGSPDTDGGRRAPPTALSSAKNVAWTGEQGGSFVGREGDGLLGVGHLRSAVIGC
jgi:hypothetical protein